MTFLVSRTSEWNPSTQPCKEAVSVTPEGVWDREWEIEIDSIDALWKFVQKHGRVIVSLGGTRVGAGEMRPHIEIYDDYRE